MTTRTCVLFPESERFSGQKERSARRAGGGTESGVQRRRSACSQPWVANQAQGSSLSRRTVGRWHAVLRETGVEHSVRHVVQWAWQQSPRKGKHRDRRDMTAGRSLCDRTPPAGLAFQCRSLIIHRLSNDSCLLSPHSAASLPPLTCLIVTSKHEQA